jgi:predicted O-methyltransferase YrrM
MRKKDVFDRFIIKFDVCITPIVYLCCLILRKIRFIGVHNFKQINNIFNNIGLFPIIDHYNDPLFNKNLIKKSLRENRNLPGLDFNIIYQLELLNNFHYNDELLKFPLEKSNKLEFYYDNKSFESGDAEFLYNIIRLFKPKRIIEIGSGYSTLMAKNAVYHNQLDSHKYICEHICIEPYPFSWLERLDIKLIKEKVEDCSLDMFSELERNDILFIDSLHVIRAQGDVLFEYLEILPKLNSGVLVHVHDIFTPKDYLDEWMENNLRFHNEQYLLEAILTLNDKLKIIGSLNYLKTITSKNLFQNARF